RIVTLVSDAIHEEVDAFLRRHFLQVEAQRENDARAAVHAPEERADFVLGLSLEFQVPEEQFPVERVAFRPEGRAEQATIRFVTSRHETLQVMAGNQFMKDGGARE